MSTGQNHLGSLLKCRLLGPAPQLLIQFGVGPENLISNKLPSDAGVDAADLGTLS